MRASAFPLLLAATAGCTEPSAPSPDRPRWEDDIERLLAAECAPCHGLGERAPDLTRYAGAVACGDDGAPWVTPGDRRSPLLLALERPDHRSLLDAAEAARLTAWVVEGQAAYATRLAHPAGWATPSAGPAFHGTALAAGGYRLAYAAPTDAEGERVAGACRGCHEPARGAGGAVACTRCHASGFTSDRCDGCHGADGDPRPVARPCGGARSARVGKHALHLDPAREAAFPAIPCSTCHAVPAQVLDEGHLDAPGADDGHADVRFAGVEGTYDPAAQTCSVRACHGAAKVSWTPTSTAAARCDGCHGDPPPDHRIERCELCHAEGLGADGRPTARTHLDGRVQVGRTCDACHRDGLEPVFPGDDPGKHRAHLSASTFTRALACTACHRVPGSVEAPGHLDSPLPAELVFDAVATSSGALRPSFDRASRRCADVGCHGAHLEGGARATPPWIAADEARVGCGDCHALPPTAVRGGAAVHPATGEADCGICHVTRSGAPITRSTQAITEEGKQAHIDGCVELSPELRPAGAGECAP